MLKVYHSDSNVTKMTRRFSRLRYAASLLASTTGGEGQDAPQGTFLRNFQDYASGRTRLNYTRDEDSLPGEIETVAINPFGLAVDTGNLVQVAFSQRVAESADLAATITAANHEAVTANIPRAVNFEPAKAVVRRFPATAPTTTVQSQITGIPYRSSGASSFTIPYGASTGNQREGEVRTAIQAAVNNLPGRNAVTFNSEEL